MAEAVHDPAFQTCPRLHRSQTSPVRLWRTVSSTVPLKSVVGVFSRTLLFGLPAVHAASAVTCNNRRSIMVMPNQHTFGRKFWRRWFERYTNTIPLFFVIGIQAWEHLKMYSPYQAQISTRRLITNRCTSGKNIDYPGAAYGPNDISSCRPIL